MATTAPVTAATAKPHTSFAESTDAETAASRISVEEYLRTTYRPDRDFVSGRVEERHVGEKPHSILQGLLVSLFLTHADDWQVVPMTEQRVQVSEDRFRIPDVCVTRPHSPDPLIVRDAPLVCIEVVSREDSLRDLHVRAKDYAGMGVENIWIVDPWERVAYIATVNTLTEVSDGLLTVPATPIRVSLPDLFARLDKLQS